MLEQTCNLWKVSRSPVSENKKLVDIDIVSQLKQVCENRGILIINVFEQNSFFLADCPMMHNKAVAAEMVIYATYVSWIEEGVFECK